VGDERWFVRVDMRCVVDMRLQRCAGVRVVFMR